jgi:hypothetical protein
MNVCLPLCAGIERPSAEHRVAFEHDPSGIHRLLDQAAGRSDRPAGGRAREGKGEWEVYRQVSSVCVAADWRIAACIGLM